jgi:hypothetical protein
MHYCIQYCFISHYRATKGTTIKERKANLSTIPQTRTKMEREEDRGEDDGGPTDQGGKNEVAEDNGGEGSENEGSF